MQKYLTENELLEAYETAKYLEEKLITFNNRKKYGQLVFLSGGAGSGKGYSVNNFIDSEYFKVRDVDEWKKAFLKIAEMKNKYPEIRGLTLKDPRDVTDLHIYLKRFNLKDRTLFNMLNDLGANNSAAKRHIAKYHL